MKKIKLLFKLSLVFLLLNAFHTTSVQAQAPVNHVFHVSTWYMITGMDSVIRAERDAVLQEYHSKVTMKNEFIVHSTSMQHFFTEDSREFITIAEYASWGDMDKAANKDSELEKLAWPDQKKREEFMKKMSSYFTHHKDAIFGGIPTLVK